MFASKMVFSINVPVSSASLRKAFSEAGLNYDESVYRARHELKYLIERQIEENLNVVAHKIKAEQESK